MNRLLNIHFFLFITSFTILRAQPIARVQFVHTYTYPANSITFPSSNAAGNAIVVMASWYSTATPTVSDTRGNTYTALTPFGDGGNGNGEPVSIAIWYAVNIAAGANTVTISGLGVDGGMTAVEYSGFTPSAGLGITATTSGFNLAATTTPNSNSFTPSPGSLLFVAFADETVVQSSIAAGSGYNLIQGDGAHVDIEEDNLNSVAGGQTASITVGAASSSWVMYVVELVPTGGSQTVGTVLWSNPGDGSGIKSIVPAVPSATGVADVFATQNDGTVMAVTSDGTTAWTATLPMFPTIVPDFQGGLVVASNGAGGSITKLDGMTGQPYPSYNLGTSFLASPPVVHTDGTIFAVQRNQDGSSAIIGIAPTTGIQNFSVPLPIPLPYYSGPGVDCPNSTGDYFFSASTYGIIVAGDGNAYVPYSYLECNGFILTAAHLRLLQLNSGGAFNTLTILDSQPPTMQYENIIAYVNMITNADTGVLLTWSLFFESEDMVTPTQYGMAITAGTSVTIVSPPVVPGQPTSLSTPIAPVLQAEDGSFVGTVQVPLPYPNNPQINMVAFDAAGNFRWMVANETPQIATADGGVIGQSGTKYDQNGSATGQSGLGADPTPGWLGSVLGTTYAAPSGVLKDIAAPSTNYATSFAAFFGGSPSGRTAIQWVMSKVVQALPKQLPNLTAVGPCYPPVIPLVMASLYPTCGNVNAIELLTTATPSFIFQNYLQNYAGLTGRRNSVAQFFGSTGGNPVVTGSGQVVLIKLHGFPFTAFAILTERFDITNNTVSAVTLTGHPLAGWRYWRVYSIGTNDVVIETGAYDQPAPGPAILGSFGLGVSVLNYAGYYIFQGSVTKIWQLDLGYIQSDLIRQGFGAQQGTNLQNSLGGIALRTFPPGNGPLLKGYWDYFGDFTNYILNNVCQSTVCN